MAVKFSYRMSLLWIVSLFLVVVSNVKCGKNEDLFDAIEKAGHGQDIQLTSSSFICNPCKISIGYKSSCQYSNVIRHLTSEQHKTKAKWSVDNQSDGSCKIIPTVQKTNLYQFFHTAKKQKCPSTSTHASISNQPSASSTCKHSNVSLPTLIAQDILHTESKHLSMERKLQVAKSRQLIQDILTEERFFFASEGQQNQQLIEQLTTTIEGLQNTFCQKVEFMLSKLNYINCIPKLFLSNLFRLSAHISMDLERTASKNQELLKISETFVIQQYQTLCKITAVENQIRTSSSVNETVFSE